MLENELVESVEVESKDLELEKALALFDDDDDKPVIEEKVEKQNTTVETTAEAPKVEEEETEEPTIEGNKDDETKTEEELYTLKHFDGDKQVNLEELTKLGQQGVDYGRVKGQLEEMRNDPRLSTADKVEKLAGLYDYKDIDKFIDDLYTGYDNSTAEDKGVTAESVKLERESKEKMIKADIIINEKESKEAITKNYDEFSAKYPKVVDSDLSKETLDKIDRGIHPIDAYEMQISNDKLSTIEADNIKLAEENKILKKNTTNDKRTPAGSIEGNIDGKSQPDYLNIWDD